MPNETTRVALSEIALAICINGISYAVMMVSDRDLYEFSLGFCLSEGLIANANEVQDINFTTLTLGKQADITVQARANQRLKQRRVALAGPTGCGLCGAESLEQAMQLPANNRQAQPQPARDIIHGATEQLDRLQTQHQGIRGNHCAVFVGFDGEIISYMEDVGRHSALDKLIGRLAQQKLLNTLGFVLLTSRCSHDLVLKISRANIPVLVTLAQPTDLAVKSAIDSNIALYCFQGQQLNRFA